MTRVHFLQCVLVQVLLIAPCFSADSDYILNCPDINGTVGEPLRLTCTLKCEEPCKIVLYKWKYYNKSELMVLKKSKSNPDLTDEFRYDFTPTKDHNGTFQFWVQLDTGSAFKNFTVRLSGNSTKFDPNLGDYIKTGETFLAGVIIATLVVLGLVALAVYWRCMCNRICNLMNSDTELKMSEDDQDD